MTVYCTAPFNGLTIREDGHVRTCCIGKTSLGNLNDMPIESIERSRTLQDIQKDMLSNSPNLKNCVGCLNLEKNSGLASLRQMYLREFPSTNDNSLALKFIDIRWNNTCNLGCLYCSKTFSSVWETRLQETRSTVQKPYQDDLLSWILDRVHHVEEIMLVGGEPMLMKQNYKLFRYLPINSRISIITNLSYDLESLPCIDNLLRRPTDKIIWNISMENVGEKFEYVRSGASWKQVEKNLKFLKKHWPETVSVNMVYSIFSAFDLEETIGYFNSIGVKKYSLAPVDDHPEINLSNFPKEIQSLAADILDNVQKQHKESLHPEDQNLYPLQGANEIMSSLRDDLPNKFITLDKFVNKIDWYDRWSEKKFETLWPEINDLIHKSL